MIDHDAKLIISENCAIRRAPSIVGDRYEIRETNLAQEFAHTMMFAGRTGLKIAKCNIFNCDFPAGTVIEDCAWEGVHQDPTPEPEPVIEPNADLSAYAVAARAILERSDRLTPEIKAGLEQLAGAVQQAAGVALPEGESATVMVQKILDAPEIVAQPELRTAIEQAFQQVVSVTGGVL